MYAVDLLTHSSTGNGTTADRARGMQVLRKVLAQALPAEADAAAQFTSQVRRVHVSSASRLTLLSAKLVHVLRGEQKTTLYCPRVVVPQY